MNESKGKLEEIQGTSVLIDGVWYDASSVIQFVPKIGSEVAFASNDNYELQFIRLSRENNNRKGYQSPRKTNTSRSTYQRKNFSSQNSFTPKNTKPFETKQERTDSIIKQVIFKAAVEEHKLYPDRALDEIYEELKDKYLNELK